MYPNLFNPLSNIAHNIHLICPTYDKIYKKMIKELNNTYLKKLVELEKAGFEPLEEIYGKYSGKGVKEDFERILKEGKLWGYFVRDELIGCIGLVRQGKSKYSEIQNLIVNPKFQGQGFGKKLIDFTEKYAQENNIPGLLIRTKHKNVKNIQIYEHLGFEKTVCILKKEFKQTAS